MLEFGLPDLKRKTSAAADLVFPNCMPLERKNTMKAKEIMEHFQEIGTWVDWENTDDQFLHGDPDAEVEGVATVWSPTNAALKEASDKGLNVFITHEPAFYLGYQGTPSADRLVREKRQLLDELNITMMRCHDLWGPYAGSGGPRYVGSSFRVSRWSRVHRTPTTRSACWGI